MMKINDNRIKINNNNFIYVQHNDEKSLNLALSRMFVGNRYHPLVLSAEYKNA